MAELTPNDLQDENRFQMILTLEHDEITPFVGEFYWQRRNWLVVCHYLITFLSLAIWVIAGISQGANLLRWLIVAGAAVVAFILLVPIHEGLHGLVYRLLGAKDIRFSVSIKEFYAYAIANQFVVNRQELTWIALTPFIVLNGALTLASIFFPAYRFFLLGLLFLHIGGTSGDWAILNFFWIHRDQRVYTYDDADEQKSYFYQQIN